MVRVVNILILGLGMVGTIFSVGLERIKNKEIKPYGVPLADFKMNVSIEDMKVVGAIDIDSKKIGKSIYDIARGYNLNPPSSLRDAYVYKGVELGMLKDMPIKVSSIDSKLSIEDSIKKLMSIYDELKPEVVIDVTTTQRGKVYYNTVKYKKDVITGKVAPSQLYAYISLKKEISHVNLIPTPVANSPAIVNVAKKNKSLVLGDDGATGATPITADILEHLRERNRKVYSVAQFNIGGNSDFLALLNEKRNEAKKETKSGIVKDILGYDADNYIRPTGYLRPLGDKKFVAMHILYESFNGVIDEIIVNMRINDSPALAGYIVDLARIAYLLRKSGIYGTCYEINAFYMKRPGPLGSRSISKIIAHKNMVKYLEGIKKEPLQF